MPINSDGHHGHGLEFRKVTSELLKSLTRDPLKAITFLDLSYLNLFGIANLTLCKNLQTVILRGNQINSVPNLEGCPSLWKIDLSCNQVKTLNGLSRFSAFGTIVLCNNELSWQELAKIRHITILNLHLVGNSKLEEDFHYRKHVIDCLPLLWTLDNDIITHKERQSVRDFLEKSTLSRTPIRHKLPRSQYIPTHMKNLTSTGVYGAGTVALMKAFGIYEIHNNNLDVRRINFLAKMMQHDVNLESLKRKKCDNTVITDLFESRHVFKEKCNMLAVLLMSSLVFSVPSYLMEAATEIAKLTNIRNVSSLSLFDLPKSARVQLVSILISAVKVDRDEQIKGGLDDKLFKCLRSFVTSLTKVIYGENEIRVSIINYSILASEIVQLFCLVPTFFYFLHNEGVKEILVNSTRNINIYDNIQECIRLELCNPHPLDENEMHGNVMTFIIEQMKLARSTEIITDVKRKRHMRSLLQNLKKPVPIYQNISACLTGSKLPKDRPSTAPGLLQGRRKQTIEQEDDSCRQPGVGDYVITGAQQLGRILGVPDANVALIQLETLPHSRYRQADFRTNSVELDGNFLYVSLVSLRWCKDANCWKALNENISTEDIENTHNTPLDSPSPSDSCNSISADKGHITAEEKIMDQTRHSKQRVRPFTCMYVKPDYKHDCLKADKKTLDGDSEIINIANKNSDLNASHGQSNQINADNFSSESQENLVKFWCNYSLTELKKSKLSHTSCNMARSITPTYQDSKRQYLNGTNHERSYHVHNSVMLKPEIASVRIQKQKSGPNYVSIVPPRSTLRKSNWMSES